ncbi:MAG TPA: signal peptidase I [Gemmatimonadaceae bacterium]|nr:signal peptidase I [Gemmatimonadaceae bacterium]
MGKGRRKRAARAAARTQQRPSRRPFHLRTRALILSVLPTLAIFLGTRQLLAEAFRISSGSMEPTLLVGDWLFVNKLRYGPHIPFTKHSLPGYASPKRGDVSVFISPEQDPSIRIAPDEVTPTLVKRIVGVPGDTLVMRHGVLTVNGTALPSPNAFVLADSVADVPQAIFSWQHQIEIRGSRFGEPIATPSLHEWGPLVVPADTYFMLGDNRDNSVDSRYYGPVQRTNLRGTPTFVYYSYDPERGVDYFRVLTAIRWRRLGTWIR